MNPFKWIIDVIKFVYNDFKSDIATVKHIAKCTKEGKPILDPEKKKQFWEMIKTITPTNMLKESWMWILCILFACAVTWMITGKYYEMRCNNFIYENYIKNQLINTFDASKELLSNLTK